MHEGPEKNSLSIKMHEWRERQNMTVEDASAMIGIKKSSWSKLESGQHRPRIETLVRLQQVFSEYSLDDLARMAGYDLPPLATSDVDRLQRIENFLKNDPRYMALLEALMQFSPQERETILLLVESMEKSYNTQQNNQ